jgi:hypothetical protein
LLRLFVLGFIFCKDFILCEEAIQSSAADPKHFGNLSLVIFEVQRLPEKTCE